MGAREKGEGTTGMRRKDEPQLLLLLLLGGGVLAGRRLLEDNEAVCEGARN